MSLLDDPDDEIYKEIRRKIIAIGLPVMNDLENAYQHLDDGTKHDLVRNRIEDVMSTIQFRCVKARLHAWVIGGGEDLLEGALIICRYRYPELDEVKVKSRLEDIRLDIRLGMKMSLTGYEKVTVMNHVIYGLRGLRGDRKNYHDPRNSYLSSTLERGMGNPLTLGIIYQVLAEKLEIPIYGVNMPNHFLLAYMNDVGTDPLHVAFYINPFSRGDVLGRPQILDFLEKLDILPQDQFFLPCTNIEMIRRMIGNLIGCYEKQDDFVRMAELMDLEEALKGPPQSS